MTTTDPLNNHDGHRAISPSSSENVKQEEETAGDSHRDHSKREPGRDLSSQVRSWTVANVTTAATVLIFAFILLKVMRATGGEPVAARALIAAASPVAVVMDAALSLAPLVIALIYLPIAEWNLRHNEGDTRDILLTIAFIVLTGIVTFTVPLLMLMGAILASFVGAWTDRRNRRKGDYSGTRLRLSNPWSGSILGVAAVFLFMTTVSGLWVPTENVSTKGGRNYAAYVVSSRDGWVTLYDMKKQRVVQERAENIIGREICGYTEWPLNKTLIQLARSRRAASEYPKCNT